jgi:phage terminase large subunit-like protein
MVAANRIGKTEGVGGYESVLHLTGDYPAWWPGRRFDHATFGWAAGDTSNTVRDILQFKLMGPIGDFGTGLIPKRAIERVTWKRNVAEAVQDVYVRHACGRTSMLTFKSYDQKRESFQGTEQHFIWLDEEPDMDIYAECLLRTMTTDGTVLCTFTPLRGMSDVVLSFMPGGRLPSEAAAQ